MMRRRCAWLLVAGYGLLILSGCVRRSLTIRTEPPGALAYVNDNLMGATPVTYDFEWYGWYRLMIRKTGYTTVYDRQLIRAPSYLWIPFDLMMELLPFPVRDKRAWSYTLSPAPTVSTPTPPLTEAGTAAVPPPRASGLPSPTPADAGGSVEGGGTTESPASAQEPANAAR